MFVVVFVILLLIGLLFYKIWSHNRYWKYVMEIPGPEGYPIIGNLTKNLTSEELWDYDRSRAQPYWPIHKLWSLNQYFISIMCPEDIELILANSVHNNKSVLYDWLKEWLGTGLLTSNGSKWHKRRKILTPAFHFNILQPFVDIFNKESDSLVYDLLKNCHQEYIDVVPPITEFTLFSIGETSLGVDLRNTDNVTYKDHIHKFGDLLQKRIINPLYFPDFIYTKTSNFKKLKKYVKILHDFSWKIIEERKKQREERSPSYAQKKRLALLDLMLEAGMDDEGLREEVDTFVFEGHDTTAMALCYVLLTLANEPTYQDEIFEEINSILGTSTSHPTYNELGEMKFMERCLKECLRLYPSVPLISRVLGQQIMSSTGYIIPKGSTMNIYIYDLHHSPEVWEDPEKFDPDRFLPEKVTGRHPFAYLPFSAGGRNCIGQKFAMLELKAAVCGILRKFKLVAVDKKEDIKFKTDLVLRPVGGIKVKFAPR